MPVVRCSGAGALAPRDGATVHLVSLVELVAAVVVGRCELVVVVGGGVVATPACFAHREAPSLCAVTGFSFRIILYYIILYYIILYYIVVVL